MDSQHLTKKERYLLRKQEKEETRIKKIRQQKNKKMFFIFLVVIIIVSLASVSVKYFLNRDQMDNQGSSKIVLSPEEYDAGTVSMIDGLVKKTYQVKNDGQGDLKIDSIWTSCMCTTAHLRVGDKVSSEFGMHTKSSLWSEKIPPGEIGYLDVVFDPAFHGPEGTGFMVREIYLSTNDLNNEQVTVRLLINVVK